MIPKIIHYCWFGRGQMPEDALKCIESWHQHMPDYQYKLWNEDNFDVNALPYTKEAYEARKFAFVSDVARLKALYEEGGLYFDVDFLAYKSFDPLMESNDAFAGFEGSKYLPVMMGVCASRPQGLWVKQMLDSYTNRHFLLNNTKFDLTPNVSALTAIMHANGLQQNGKEQYYKDLHIYPVDFFCPKQTTGEYLRTDNTYCESIGVSSWASSTPTLKGRILNLFGPTLRPTLIKLKRTLFGR